MLTEAEVLAVLEAACAEAGRELTRQSCAGCSVDSAAVSASSAGALEQRRGQLVVHLGEPLCLDQPVDCPRFGGQ